jgi:hypothetical protein
MTIPCAIYSDLTSKEDYVTDVIIFNQLKYICIATNFGNIKVFKWDPKKYYIIHDVHPAQKNQKEPVGRQGCIC